MSTMKWYAGNWDDVNTRAESLTDDGNGTPLAMIFDDGGRHVGYVPLAGALYGSALDLEYESDTDAAAAIGCVRSLADDAVKYLR